ncbi:restriction endonuclease subunit S [Enterococcus faecium]|nr:restriction endonuclease subunit S [Enterococcus faecium]
MAKIDDSVKKKVPELRFKGFTDEWEERKFADFIDVKSGKDYKHLNSGSIPVYGTGGYMLSVDRALSDIDAIGIGRKGTIDKPYLLKAPFWTVDTLFYAVPKQNIDLQFSLSIFKKINWKKFDESTGVPSLSKTVINSVGASVPSYEEQQKIGSFFKRLDNTITLHQRKLDLLKEQKKGYLQKMFPKNGSKIPELRFNGFSGDWEERKLGEITTSYSGGTPSAGNSSYYKGDIPFIRSGEINSSKTELFLTEEGFNNSSAKLVEVGDILYALYGATSGEVGISQINGAINQAILAIKPIEGYESQFIMQWLKLQKQKIIDKYLQGGQGNLSGTIVKDLFLRIPDSKEQKKIGQFFKQLDDTIALHQRKLDLLKEQKKGFLQKMFV